MRTQYVTFQVEVTARVDAYEHKNDVLTIAEVSSVMVEGVAISLATVPAALYDILEDTAAETALTKDEWHD